MEYNVVLEVNDKTMMLVGSKIEEKEEFVKVTTAEGIYHVSKSCLLYIWERE